MVRPLHAAILFTTILMVYTGCGETREESRQKRLDTFRAILPEEVLQQFNAIDSEADCERIGILLSQARVHDPELDAALDSIMHAELIDTFTDGELVRFFWYYFAYSIRIGAVPET